MVEEGSFEAEDVFVGGRKSVEAQEWQPEFILCGEIASEVEFVLAAIARLQGARLQEHVITIAIHRSCRCSQGRRRGTIAGEREGEERRPDRSVLIWIAMLFAGCSASQKGPLTQHREASLLLYKDCWKPARQEIRQSEEGKLRQAPAATKLLPLLQ